MCVVAVIDINTWLDMSYLTLLTVENLTNRYKIIPILFKCTYPQSAELNDQYFDNNDHERITTEQCAGVSEWKRPLSLQFKLTIVFAFNRARLLLASSQHE